MTERERRVLSIQSTVVHGYAGGRSATFPLQLLGFVSAAILAPDLLLSRKSMRFTPFSSPTIRVPPTLPLQLTCLGYSQWTGFKTTGEQILDLFHGLEISGIDNFQYLLTGYQPSAATVLAIGEIGKKLKAKDPRIVWSIIPMILS